MQNELHDNLAIVDAHQHFWDLERNYHPWLHDDPAVDFRYGDYSAIRKNYLPDDYFADARPHNVVKTVHVEAEWDPADPVGETCWLMKLHQRYGVPNGIVAQARLNRDDIDDVLAAQTRFALVRSIRHKPVAAATAAQVKPGVPGSMSDPRWREGYGLLQQYGLMFDLQTPYWHLYEAAELAADFPATQIILNHTGLPADRSVKGLNAWRQAMQVFAEQANVAVKISGIGLKNQPWTLADNRSIVLDTIDLFGVDRCLFASNYPVDSLVGSFDTIFSGFKHLTRDFTQADRQQLFHDNAVRYYRLSS